MALRPPDAADRRASLDTDFAPTTGQTRIASHDRRATPRPARPSSTRAFTYLGANDLLDVGTLDGRRRRRRRSTPTTTATSRPSSTYGGAAAGDDRPTRSAATGLLARLDDRRRRRRRSAHLRDHPRQRPPRHRLRAVHGHAATRRPAPPRRIGHAADDTQVHQPRHGGLRRARRAARDRGRRRALRARPSPATTRAASRSATETIDGGAAITRELRLRRAGPAGRGPRRRRAPWSRTTPTTATATAPRRSPRTTPRRPRPTTRRPACRPRPARWR